MPDILRHPIISALMFGAGALFLFLMGIGKPAALYFDEGYFVPEARAFILHAPNPNPQAPPLGKPPLGKLIMAVGMKVAGDSPFGWRVTAALCGALTLVAVYLWTYLLLHDARLAWIASGLTLFNNFLFVMSRVAIMDAFLMFFLMWSLVTFTAAVVSDRDTVARRYLLICSGALVGLAGACKWNAIDTLVAFLLVSFALLWVGRRAPADSNSSHSRYARNVGQIGVLTLLVALVVVPLTSYSLTFWPLCRILHRPFSIRELVNMNVFIWHYNTTAFCNPFISSRWYTWPLKATPLRFLSYLVGNPVVAWGGLMALVLCLRRFWKTFDFPEGLVLLLYTGNLLQWAVTPEKGTFYYYYYPAAMMLGVAIAIALRDLPARVRGIRVSFIIMVPTVIIFAWCYPRMAHLEFPWDCALGCWW